MSVRYPFLIGAAGIGFVISVVLFAVPLVEAYRSEHRRLLDLYAPVIDAPAQAYVQCLMAQGCFARWTSAVNTVAPLPLLGVLASLVFAAFGLGPKGAPKVYAGTFGDRSHFRSLRLADPLHDPVAGKSLLIGYHLPLPDTQPERALTLQGERLEGLDPQLLALQPGYGGRPELGHAAVFGATRSGKSLHLTAQLGRWSGSFVALDIRGELYRRTAGLKARSGEVIVLSPEGVGAHYDALSEIIATRNGFATAAEIIAARHEDREKAFADRASSGIEAALRAAVCLGERPIPFLRRLVKEGGVKTFVETIYAVDDDETRVALNTFLDPNSGADFSPAKVLEDKFLVSSWGSMRNKLKPFLRADVQSLFGGSDFSAADLMKRPAGVYLQFPEETLEATKTVYNLVVSSLLRGMMRYVDRERQGTLPRVPVLVGLDEAATAPLADLKTLLATTASRGISALVYLQSPSQFDDLYGKSVTTSILANCSLELYYKIEDLATARYVSERCGKTSAPTEAKSQRRQLFAPPPTVSESTTGREVLTVDEAMLLGGETRQVALGFVSGKRPLLFKRFNYYEHPWLDKLMAAYPAPELRETAPQPEPEREPAPASAPASKPVAETPDI